MEPGGSTPHSQGLSNNPYPEPNKPNFFFPMVILNHQLNSEALCDVSEQRWFLQCSLLA